MGKLYIAYGSNLNLAQMAARCPSASIYAAGLLTEPLPAKAGRFGVLLKQPKAVSPVKFSFTPIRLSYLKVIGFCFLLQILIFDILLDNFIRHIPAACHKVSPCP